MTHCRLDIFPVELVHQLLGYFWTHEILRTFSDISLYLDAVLLAYPYYRVNFKSIRRTDFDLVCQRILPDQVISLTLSDDEDTPGQVGLFLSRFRVEQFIHLRSLTVVDVGPDWWEPIVSKLVQLKHLSSFFYVTLTSINQWISNIPDKEVNELDERLFDTYSPVLPRLNRLRLNHGDYLSSTSLPRLRHLTLGRCSAQTLEHICCAAPQLESLDIEFQHYVPGGKFLYPFSHLNRFVLRITGLSVSMNDVERLCSTVPRLKHLELSLQGDNDLVNGQRWRTLTSGLLTFKFIFTGLIGLEAQDFESFCTPFWLEEKRWFVAYAESEFSFFSMPHFADMVADEDFQSITYSTAADNRVFYEHVGNLTLSKFQDNSNRRFTRVETLNLECHIDVSTLQTRIDLNQVQHLTLRASKKSFMLVSLLNEMPSLYKLSIRGLLRTFLQQTSRKAMEKIRILEFGNYDEDGYDYTIEQVCRVFPRVECLHVKHMCTIEQMLNFIDRLKHLSSASFHCFPSYITSKHKRQLCLNFQSSLDQICRAQACIGTYRFNEASVCMWI